MAETEFIIVGKSEKYGDCLVYTCGKSREQAEKVLNKMLTNPDNNDKYVMRGLTDFHINEIPCEDGWWNQGTN